MEVFDVMDIIIQKDLLSYADKLEEFLDEIADDKANRKALLGKLYTTVALFRWARVIEANKDKKHIICKEEISVLEYANTTMPPLTSPVKTIKELRAYIDEIRNKFVVPLGEVITSDEIEAVMKYLDDTYDFTNLVMSDHEPIFAIINNSKIYCNNECVGAQTINGIQNIFFLYNMNEKALLEGMDIHKSPITILYHELGHSLLFRYAGYEECVPEDLLLQLEKIAPDLRITPYLDQCEVLADIFAMGMMKDSPFEKD